jgi:hypothetical protein
VVPEMVEEEEEEEEEEEGDASSSDDGLLSLEVRSLSANLSLRQMEFSSLLS